MKKTNWLLAGVFVLLLLVVTIWQTPFVSADAVLPQELSTEEVIGAVTGEAVTKLESGILPYYSMENKLGFYRSGEFTFRVDSSSGQFVEVYPYDSSKVFNLKHEELELEELDKIAKEYIEKLNIRIDYEPLTLQIGNKGEVNYFFRWITGSPKDADFGKFFIQVGLTKDGQLLNLVNTLPFMHQDN